MEFYQPKNQLFKNYIKLYNSISDECSAYDYHRYIMEYTTTAYHQYKLPEMTADFDKLSKADFLDKYDDTYSSYIYNTYTKKNIPINDNAPYGVTIAGIYQAASEAKEHRENVIRQLEKIEIDVSNFIKL